MRYWEGKKLRYTWKLRKKFWLYERVKVKRTCYGWRIHGLKRFTLILMARCFKGEGNCNKIYNGCAFNREDLTSMAFIFYLSYPFFLKANDHCLRNWKKRKGMATCMIMMQLWSYQSLSMIEIPYVKTIYRINQIF